MSLSDSCSEISSDLARTFAHYADWDYSVDQLLPLVDAMFNITAVGTALDLVPNRPRSDLDRVIHRRVMAELLHHIDVRSDTKEAVLETLCRVASQSPRLNNAIAEFREWIASPAGKKYQKDMDVSYDDIQLLFYRNNQ